MPSIRDCGTTLTTTRCPGRHARSDRINAGELSNLEVATGDNRRPPRPWFFVVLGALTAEEAFDRLDGAVADGANDDETIAATSFCRCTPGAQLISHRAAVLSATLSGLIVHPGDQGPCAKWPVVIPRGSDYRAHRNGQENDTLDSRGEAETHYRG